jgi:acetyl/propionyl-CoA carboxylase alpha subunit
MARALGEYQVLGIRTTIPFFVWLMRQPEYREGRYDTTWLDRLMAERRGASFNELDEDERRLVTIAAAIDAYRRARAGGGAVANGSAPSAWQRTARTEALRS